MARENANEARRQVIQAALDAERSASERNRLGQFATPNSLAVEIAQYVKSVAGRRLRSIRFADPAVGTGSFFSAALSVFGSGRIESAVGVELDPRFCDAARELWGEAGLEVVQGDFTRIVAVGDRPAAPNLILTNPPYVRHHHLQREDKERLQALANEMAGVRINGLAGLYIYFVLLATEWMEDGGYAAWLIPSEFMDVNYGRSVKRYLLEQVKLLQVHRFDPTEVQFADALVSSAVVFFRKGKPPVDHQVTFSFGGTLTAPKVTTSGPTKTPGPSPRTSRSGSPAPSTRRTRTPPRCRTRRSCGSCCTTPTTSTS
jgi:adenine-specific DNA-methyltransferase